MYSFWQKMERLSRAVAPAMVTTLMVLLASVPLHIPGAHAIMPAFTLVNIYYWGIFLPGALPYGFLFALGLLQDALAGTPLGVCSFIDITFALMLAMERRIFGKMLFTTVWIGFALLSGVAVLLQWGIMSLYDGRLLPLAAHVLHWGVTVLSYPLLHVLLTRIYRALQ